MDGVVQKRSDGGPVQLTQQEEHDMIAAAIAAGYKITPPDEQSTVDVTDVDEGDEYEYIEVEDDEEDEAEEFAQYALTLPMLVVVNSYGLTVHGPSGRALMHTDDAEALNEVIDMISGNEDG